ncbi:hypothetical protein NS319_02635 [Sphingomonas sanguinis]|uniref:Uncharacterized protein n=1 Tax=Sphingomonas sanguinis TaxID=33051 RepID=A0A147I587_9SPHN|nr:hypothetical protein NS319_02635 [Sphingomonas sanguinis]
MGMADKRDGILDLGRRQHPRSPDMLATRLGFCQASLGPLADQSPLKFGKCRHHVKHKPPAGRSGIDILHDRSEVHPTFAEHVDELDKA